MNYRKNEYIYLLKLIQLENYGFKLTQSINGLQLLALGSENLISQLK